MRYFHRALAWLARDDIWAALDTKWEHGKLGYDKRRAAYLKAFAKRRYTDGRQPWGR